MPSLCIIFQTMKESKSKLLDCLYIAYDYNSWFPEDKELYMKKYGTGAERLSKRHINTWKNIPVQC